MAGLVLSGKLRPTESKGIWEGGESNYKNLYLWVGSTAALNDAVDKKGIQTLK